MDLEDLEPGNVFRLTNEPIFPETPVDGLYEFYGHGWYGRPYSGNPRCEPGRKPRGVIMATNAEQQLYNEHVIKLHEQMSNVKNQTKKRT